MGSGPQRGTIQILVFSNMFEDCVDEWHVNEESKVEYERSWNPSVESMTRNKSKSGRVARDGPN